MLTITLFGESIFIILIIILLLIFKQKKVAKPVILATIISFITNFILKNMMGRLRPVNQFVDNLIFNYSFPNSYSFPSGHAQTSLVFYFSLAFCLINKFYKGKHKKLILSFSLILPILISISRIILGVHYFTDILAGLIIGLIIISNLLYFKLLNNN